MICLGRSLTRMTCKKLKKGGEREKLMQIYSNRIKLFSVGKHSGLRHVIRGLGVHERRPYFRSRRLFFRKESQEYCSLRLAICLRLLLGETVPTQSREFRWMFTKNPTEFIRNKFNPTITIKNGRKTSLDIFSFISTLALIHQT